MKAIELEKVSVRDIQNLKTVFDTLNEDENYSLLNKDSLTQPIQLQLFQKQKTFPQLFSPISKSS